MMVPVSDFGTTATTVHQENNSGLHQQSRQEKQVSHT